MSFSFFYFPKDADIKYGCHTGKFYQKKKLNKA